MTASQFTIRQLRNSEIGESYQLRHQVYAAAGYLNHLPKRRWPVDVDEYDRSAIPIGAVDLDTGKVVGAVRLISCAIPVSCWSIMIDHGSRPLPSVGDLVAQRLVPHTFFHPVKELSRLVVHPSFRHRGLVPRMADLAVALAGDANVILGCLARHAGAYKRWGFSVVAGLEQVEFPDVNQTGVVLLRPAPGAA